MDIKREMLTRSVREPIRIFVQRYEKPYRIFRFVIFVSHSSFLYAC